MTLEAFEWFVSLQTCESRFAAYADWISGTSNAVSLGGVFVIDQHLSIQASMLRSNDQDRLSGVLVNITHTFDLAHPFDW